MPALKKMLPKSLSAWAFSFLCLSMLLISLPRLIGSVYALYPETLLKQNTPLTDEVYGKAIDNLNDALQWHNDPRYWQLMGICYLHLFNSPAQSTEEKLRLLDKAQDSMVNGLKGSPIDPFAWFRLASARSLAGASVDSVAAAYKLSLYSGRVEPELVMPRLILGYKYLYAFDSELRQMWLKQIPIAYQFQPAELVNFTVLNPGVKPFVEAVFWFDTAKLKQFNHAFENTYQQTIRANQQRH